MKKEWKQFLTLCQKAQSLDQIEEVLNLFLTAEEKEMIISRYKIVKVLLSKEFTQREISQREKVSIAQITRGSNALKNISYSLKQFLESHL
jgi:TrpR family trp operon transcriptional repressor